MLTQMFKQRRRPSPSNGSNNNDSTSQDDNYSSALLDNTAAMQEGQQEQNDQLNDNDDNIQQRARHGQHNQVPTATNDAALMTTASSCRPPRASHDVISKLPRIRIFEEDIQDLDGDANSETAGTVPLCGICCDVLVDPERILLTSLPCGHMYHTTCIVRWLNRTCTCPECRYELETSDASYEVGRRERMKNRPVVPECSCEKRGNTHHRLCHHTTTATTASTATTSLFCTEVSCK